jgi:multimeric flavodoxin WrbA
MKVLMLNGSAKAKGNTNRALVEIGEELKKAGIDYEIFQIGPKPIRDCIGCGRCTEEGCVFTDDSVNEFIAKAKEADGFVFGTPVYYAHPSGRILSFLDRVFYSSKDALTQKPAAAIAIARRAGTSASLDTLQKFISNNAMPMISSTYWNLAFGRVPGEIEQDAEGLQTMRNLGKNMAWILKCIEAGKKAGIEAPAMDVGARTHFIR